jgi:hypothetical protein
LRNPTKQKGQTTSETILTVTGRALELIFLIGKQAETATTDEKGLQVCSNCMATSGVRVGVQFCVF